MLLQHPNVPCLAITGADYCHSLTTQSARIQSLSRIVGGFPLLIPIVHNSDPTLQTTHFSSDLLPSFQQKPIQAHKRFGAEPESHNNSTTATPTTAAVTTTTTVNTPTTNNNKNHNNSNNKNTSCFSNLPTPTSQVMPRPSPSNGDQDGDFLMFTEPPPGPVVAGCKRDASALSAKCPVVVPPNQTPDMPVDCNDQCTFYLPPKLKESERMMHIQRWVNHLPWNLNHPCDNSNRTHLSYAVLPIHPQMGEDRELTPPPGQSYLTRLPFTAEEHQAMTRFFPNHASHYRQIQQAPILPEQHPPRYHPFPNQCSNQQPSNNHHFSSSQRPSQDAGTGFHAPRHMQDYMHDTDRKQGAGGPEDISSSRFFAEWETRLISRLFKEFFHGNPKPTGVSGTLPSLSEVRSRIASSRLRETRTATAVRAKIRRMQSSGTWLKYE